MIKCQNQDGLSPWAGEQMTKTIYVPEPVFFLLFFFFLAPAVLMEAAITITHMQWCEGVTGLFLWIYMSRVALPPQRPCYMESYNCRRRSNAPDPLQCGTESDGWLVHFFFVLCMCVCVCTCCWPFVSTEIIVTS